MTKKDFELIARVVRRLSQYDKDAHIYAAGEFAAELATTNPRFDRTRFLEACGITP